jgi:hypothetical protein
MRKLKKSIRLFGWAAFFGNKRMNYGRIVICGAGTNGVANDAEK